MSQRPWYKRYGADFIHGTMGLSLEEKGAYSIILDLIYDRGAPIIDDARYLAGVCGCSVRKWSAIRARLLEMGKIVAKDGFISNSRAEKEIEISAKSSNERAENGAKGGEKRAENEASRRNINSLVQATLKPARINQKPEEEYPQSPQGGCRPLDDLLDRLIAAAGGNVLHMSAGIEVVRPILDLQAMGCDLEQDILPAIAEWVPSLPEPLKTWAARPLRDRVLARQSARMRGRGGTTAAAQEIPERLWEARVAEYRVRPDQWPRGLGKPPDHPECKAPASILAKHGFRSAA